MAVANDIMEFIAGVSQGRQNKSKRELEQQQLKIEKELLKKRELALKADSDFISKLAGQPEQMGNLPIPGLPANDPQQIGPVQTLAPAVPGQQVADLLGTPEGQALALQSGRIDLPGLLRDRALSNTPNIIDEILKLQGGSALVDPVSAMVAAQTGDIRQLKSLMPKFDTVQTQEGARIKGINPLTGQEMFDVGEEKAPNVSAEQAGKLEMLNQAVTDIDKAVNLITPGGQIDRTVLFQMQAPGGGLGKGRAARSLFRNAMNAKLRAETGAQANPSELDDMEKRFMPSPLDLTSPGLVEQKIQRLREFMEGTLNVATLPPSLRDRVEKRRTQKGNEGTQNGLTPEQEARRQELLRKARGAN